MEIPLTQGQVAIIDDGDAELVAPYKWYANKRHGIFYAVASGGPGVLIRMHRLILGLAPGEIGDHRDGDGLNNRRSNLRRATPTQNQQNKKINRLARNAFKGIFEEDPGRWAAKIRVNGRRIRKFGFSSPEEAARAYDQLAREHFGEFARCNFSD